MNKRTGEITFHGNPLTLLGDELKIGEKVPDFSLADNDLSPKNLADYAGKVLIISAVPSLDTPVCDMETRRFNTEAGNLSDEITILTVSMDLPFAQKRWCGAAGVESVTTLSDYRGAEFGKNWGVLIEELHLLSRTIFVVAKDGTLAYQQTVAEVTDEPDYDAVIAAAKKSL
ncbi:MAG: thiol peroxidase [Desulfovibrio sp.]